MRRAGRRGRLRAAGRVLSWGLAALLLVAALPARAPARGPRARAAAASIRVGSQTLTLCASAPRAYCGRMRVPLDWSAPSGPGIGIVFRWYPASGEGAARGTVLPVEGGPGYGSIGSAEYYAQQYGPLLARWNMLVVDNRGTGESTPVSCPQIQHFTGRTGTSAFQLAAARCAKMLNARWHYPNGHTVHASDLFTSAAAAHDLAAVVGALALPPVDLYGDSYGSFFAQVFAARYPWLVRSVTLDSTYQVQHLDPWYRSAITAMPGDFDAVCARFSACASAAPGSSWEHIAALAGRLRSAPVEGVVPGPSGRREAVSMDVVGLVDLVNDAAADPWIYRELDAAARALTEGGDPAPLLRLYAQRLHEDEAYSGPASSYSGGLYLAVSCLDYPQLFDMTATPAVRAQELAAAQAALGAATFSPFTTAEWIAQNQNTEAYSACLEWPAPRVAEPPVQGSPPLLPSTLPVLVLGGELDTWTPPGDVGKVLAELGGDTRFVALANSTHVVGEGDTECGSLLIRGFVEEPAALASLDASCAARVPPIHAVGAFPAGLAAQPPLSAAAGNAASPAELQLAAAALATAGDAVARHEAIEFGQDHGLRGGAVRAEGSGRALVLEADELVPGVPVSGRVTLSPAPGLDEGLAARATLRVGSGRAGGEVLEASWSTRGRAPATVSGTAGGALLAGQAPAP